jgi:coenzyme Q-binding protein COQ10
MASHTLRLHLDYAPGQLFDLVADVEHYPDFLPGVIAARVTRRHQHTIWVTMTIAAGPISREFSTIASLDRPHRIAIEGRDELFEHFRQRWTFAAADHGGTVVEYHVDFQFRSRILQALMGRSFEQRASRTMTAFRNRARHVYGAPHAPQDR